MTAAWRARYNNDERRRPTNCSCGPRIAPTHSHTHTGTVSNSTNPNPNGAREEGGCGACGRLLPRSEYSNKQWKKPAGKRCIACVAKERADIQKRTADKRKKYQEQQQRKWAAAGVAATGDGGGSGGDGGSSSSLMKRRRKIQSMMPTAPPSDADVDAAVRVCLWVSADDNRTAYTTGARFKLLRCALASLVEHDQRRFFDGIGKDAYRSAKRTNIEKLKEKPVSYTHLTLPTIYSV